ncbi:MAG TPA: lysylphosphatidylglycerol synthase domain-containing protein, partial [Dehalococcoidia bacterium]|nr:lysylphosphatidylglycerol synthase domain-containing protein [Dehalococcoidia bacterium]
SCAFVGAVGLTIGVGVHHSSLGAYAVAGFLVAALPVALHPRILVPVANRLLRLARRDQLDAASVLSAKQTLLVFCAFAVSYCINGAGFWLVLRVVAPEAQVNPALAIGAYSLAGLVGVLVLFVPSGLGVREAALVALLGSVISPETALVAAGLARALNVLADLAAPGLLATFDLTRRLISHRSATVEAAGSPALQRH